MSSSGYSEWILLDEATAPQNWRITSDELGLNFAPAFSISMRVLHGGRQEGSVVIDIDTGAMKVSVVPTRGMNVLEAVAGKVRLGWDSPVKEVVNPAFINLADSGGLGWLQGFNELVARCGYQWFGHPGVDRGTMLSLHGLASCTPASRVVLRVDTQPPYAIRLMGELREQAFKQIDFLITTELATEAGSQSFCLHDTLTNQGDYAREYQALYHSNFGPPLLEAGARYAAPVKQVSPFNERAAQELDSWQVYGPPTPHYDETAYNVVPYGDEQGNSLAVLHNAAGTEGVSVGFHLQQLPCFTLWKNTDTLGQGYVTGLEPGTGFPYNRSLQRALDLVPTIGSHEERHFDLTYELLANKAAVDRALQQVTAIQAGRSTEIRKFPLVVTSHE